MLGIRGLVAFPGHEHFDYMIPNGQVGGGVGVVRGARWAVLAMVLVAGAAQARAVGGIQMADAISLEGQKVALDHMEMKKLLVFDLYVWGLYLEQKPASTQEAIDFQGPKQLQFHFKRGLSRKQLASAFRDFLSNGRVSISADMKRQSEQLVQSLNGVNKGDSLLITYLPDKGLMVSGEGSQGTVIPGKAFADALFTAWLRENPIYERN